MTNQARPELAVELVLFTVLSEKELKMMWSRDLLSPGTEERDQGLSLYVVTMRGENGRILPGGFVEGHESIAEAGERILEDTLGISTPVRLRQVGTFDQPDRNPSSRVVSIASWGFIRFRDLLGVLGGKDRVGLELVNSGLFIQNFSIEHGGLTEFDGVSRFGFRYAPTKTRGHLKQLTHDLGERILALDHDEIVFYAWRKLRYAFSGKLDPFRYLGVKALGDEFRLSDLQEFQDVACGISTHRDQFRRQMLSATSFLEETLKVDSSRQGKPAALYKLGVDVEAGND